MIPLLGLLALGWVLGIGLLTIYTVYTLTHPPRRTYASALARNTPGDPGEMSDHPKVFSTWEFTSRGLSLPVWDVKGEDPAGPVVIMTHGWGDSRIGGLSRLETIAACASRVIMWDMPGHGDAPGTSALGTGEVEDLLTLIQIVQEPEQGKELPALVLYGWSMGAGVSLAAARRYESASLTGVIIEGVYRFAHTPARNMLGSMRLPYTINLPLAMAWLGLRFGVGTGWNGVRGTGMGTGQGERFDRAVHAAALNVPVLAIHGGQDPISPLAEAQEIIKVCKDGRLVCIEQGGHSGLWTQPQSGAHLDGVVKEFLREVSLRVS